MNKKLERKLVKTSAVSHIVNAFESSRSSVVENFVHTVSYTPPINPTSNANSPDYLLK